MVPNFPFTFSQAIAEFGGSGSASDLLTRAGLPSTGAMSQLALAVKFALISLVTTTSSPYLYFTFDGTYTICHHNNGGTQQNYQLIKGQVWINLQQNTSQVQYENCTAGAWFLVDGTLRGVRKYQQGTCSLQSYFSRSNGGAYIQTPVPTLNWP